MADQGIPNVTSSGHSSTFARKLRPNTALVLDPSDGEQPRVGVHSACGYMGGSGPDGVLACRNASYDVPRDHVLASAQGLSPKVHGRGGEPPGSS